jgi:uncharacterized membrane protein YcaP (DUF421 family)
MFFPVLGSIWPNMFGLHLSVAEKVLRPLVVYVFLIVLLRIFGKRELAQLNPFDLVVLLTISNTVQNAIIGDDNSVTGGLLGALALFAINYLVVRFVLRHRRLDQILEGAPTVLIENGRIDRKGLAKELLSQAELTIAAHRQGFSRLDEVESCILEPGGVFSMRRKEQAGEPKASEILAKLDQLSRQIGDLKGRLERNC